MPSFYLKPKPEMDEIYIFHPAQTKNRQYLLTVRPFQFGLSFLFYFCIMFLCNGLCPAHHRLCPNRWQNMFLLHCLNNESHYLPFLPLRHHVANFFPVCFINLHCIKIYFTTRCRKLSLLRLKIPMNFTLRHRVVKFLPARSQNYVIA